MLKIDILLSKDEKATQVIADALLYQIEKNLVRIMQKCSFVFE